MKQRSWNHNSKEASWKEETDPLQKNNKQTNKTKQTQKEKEWNFSNNNNKNNNTAHKPFDVVLKGWFFWGENEEEETEMEMEREREREKERERECVCALCVCVVFREKNSTTH